MRILIAGATGFIGSALSSFLSAHGHSITKLVRKKASKDEIKWDPVKGRLESSQLENFDAFINLAGENISSRWTEKRKRAILDSRIHSTKTLVQAISRLKSPPKTFINASAIGYYGNRGDQLLTEASSNGTGFLAHVCEEWEYAAEPLEKQNIRLIYTRFGVVLSPKGGALAKMLIPFKLGLGGVVGSGKQYMSWISLDDLLGIFNHLLQHPDLQGPFNVVAPHPVTNEVFTKTLGKVLSRPTILPLPAGLARFIFGEMADETLLTSQNVSCQKLLNSGYQFCQPELESALSQMLGIH